MIMNPLLILLLVPLLTITGIVLVKDVMKVRLVSAIGMSAQLVFAFVLLALFYHERNLGNTDEMLFVSTTTWYESFNIQLKFGIDGISVSMILLTAIVTFAGIFASWQVEYLTKEFLMCFRL